MSPAAWCRAAARPSSRARPASSRCCRPRRAPARAACGRRARARRPRAATAGSKAPPSSEHSKVTPASSAENSNVARSSLVGLSGPASIDVSGAIVSITVQARVAGEASALPAASTARTASVWSPGREVAQLVRRRAGLERAAVQRALEARAPAAGVTLSLPVNSNVASGAAVVAGGPAVIVGRRRRRLGGAVDRPLVHRRRLLDSPYEFVAVDLERVVPAAEVGERTGDSHGSRLGAVERAGVASSRPGRRRTRSARRGWWS